MPNVLVVDDSPIDLKLVEGILKKDPRMRVRTACNGSDALSKLPDAATDIVVTDMQMPELDGLQLVTAMRFHFPRIPVVLVTAHGSEELAIRALEQGAASYVPKSQLAERLLEAVDQVLALARADRSYEMLAECMGRAEFQFTIRNDLVLLDRLVELVQQIVVSMGLTDVGGQVRLGMALEEALRMATYRGNLELKDEELMQVQMHREEGAAMIEARCQQSPYRERVLNVWVHITPNEARFGIRHDGPPLTLRSPAGSTELEDSTDRSLILMNAFMDEVNFHPDGREWTMVKRRKTSDA